MTRTRDMSVVYIFINHSLRFKKKVFYVPYNV